MQGTWMKFVHGVSYWKYGWDKFPHIYLSSRTTDS